MIQSADHISGLTLATVTLTISKAGAAFASPAGAVTEIGNGWYKVALTNVDTNTLGELAFHATATGGDPTDFVDQVTVFVPGGTVNANVTNINGTPVSVPLAANVTQWNGTPAPAFPNNWSSLFIDGSGNVDIVSNVKKNTAWPTFKFVMTDDQQHRPTPGLTIAASVAIDGFPFVPTAGSVFEVSNGVYGVGLQPADTNGNYIMLRLTATGADDLNILLVTQP